MKKLISLILCLLLVAVLGVSSAELNLSSMSLQELIDLQQQITMAMWESDEWQEVEVPAGVYRVGKDIPAGRWTIKPASGYSYIELFSEIDEYGVTYKDYTCLLDSVELDTGVVASSFSDDEIFGDYSDFYASITPSSVTYDLKSGVYIKISYGSVIFTNNSGLGFKFN